VLDERRIAEAVRAMERANDRDVRRSLRDGRARDLYSGAPVPRYLYRLACGHIIQVISAPLRGPQDQYCADCGRRQGVVEHLTER
jgi:hypothetical protein